MELPSWPGLAAAPVTVGGVTMTAAAACRLASGLEASRTSAIAPLLSRAGCPGLDSRAAAAPFLAWSRQRDLHRDGEGRALCGAAGRHVVKDALVRAIAAAIASARAALAEDALRLIGTDERYAAAIASSVAPGRRPAGSVAA